MDSDPWDVFGSDSDEDPSSRAVAVRLGNEMQQHFRYIFHPLFT